MSPEDFIEISSENPSKPFDSVALLRDGQVQTWPAGQPIVNLDDPRIFGTRFLDTNVVHREMIDGVLAQAAKQNLGMLGFGGRKIREVSTWQLPAAKLLTMRALLFFCKCYGATAAHVTDKWANVMETGDYSYPHCHYDCTASLVYYLDMGEPDPREKLAGRFHFADPRIPFCCSTEAERPTRGLLPDTREGTMILFPGEFVHFVHPYRGRRSRITIAWNILAGPPRAEGSPNPAAISRGMFQG